MLSLGDRIAAKLGDVVHLVPLNDILYVEAANVYVTLHLAGKKTYCIRMTFEAFLDKYSDRFFCTHRSYAVQLAHVTHINDVGVWFGEDHVPISCRKRKEVLELLRTAQ